MESNHRPETIDDKCYEHSLSRYTEHGSPRGPLAVGGPSPFRVCRFGRDSLAHLVSHSHPPADWPRDRDRRVRPSGSLGKTVVVGFCSFQPGFTWSTSPTTRTRSRQRPRRNQGAPMELAAGIEPASPRYELGAWPLCYASNVHSSGKQTRHRGPHPRRITSL